MSTVATLQPAATVFHEEQYFDWRVYAFIAAAELAAGIGMLWFARQWTPVATLLSNKASLEFLVCLLPAVAMPLLLVLALLRMTTEVTPTELRVWFGWIPIYRKAIQVSGIVRHQVVEYRPIADYGGWGIRAGRNGERALNARGNRGVRLELADGTKLLIGSQRPEELADTLEAARRPGVA